MSPNRATTLPRPCARIRDLPRAACRRIFPPSLRQRIFRRLDLDGDGELTGKDAKTSVEQIGDGASKLVALNQHCAVGAAIGFVAAFWKGLMFVLKPKPPFSKASGPRTVTSTLQDLTRLFPYSISVAPKK